MNKEKKIKKNKLSNWESIIIGSPRTFVGATAIACDEEFAYISTNDSFFLVNLETGETESISTIHNKGINHILHLNNKLYCIKTDVGELYVTKNNTKDKYNLKKIGRTGDFNNVNIFCAHANVLYTIEGERCFRVGFDGTWEGIGIVLVLH